MTAPMARAAIRSTHVTLPRPLSAATNLRIIGLSYHPAAGYAPPAGHWAKLQEPRSLDPPIGDDQPNPSFCEGTPGDRARLHDRPLDGEGGLQGSGRYRASGGNQPIGITPRARPNLPPSQSAAEPPADGPCRRNGCASAARAAFRGAAERPPD